MGLAILELILVTARIFKAERQQYYENKVKKLMQRIYEVEDSSFYKKDLEVKGKAQRDLFLEVEDLRAEYVREARI